MNRYDRYKDSGIPWLGEVPVHWDVKRLKFLARIQNGADYKHVETNDGYPVIGSGGQFAYANSYLYDGESVLLGRKGTIDRPLYVIGKFWTVDTMYYTEILKNTYPKYFYYLTLTIDFGRYSTQTALPSMTQTALNNLVFAVPHYEEQTTIAHYLDTKLGEIDALIDKQQTLLEKLAEQRTAVITHAVTKGLNPTAPMKNSGVEWLGDVPAHWEVKRLKFSVRNISQKVESQTSDLRYFGLENIESFTGRLILNIELESEGIANKFQENDVLFGKLRPYLAKVHLATQNGLVSTETLVFRAKKAINPKFLFYFCVSKDFIDAVNGTTFGSKMPRANWEDIGNFKMLIPSLEEQAIIIDYLNQETAKIDRLCETVNQTIGRLKEYRTALITQAVTGKIKVTDE